MDNNPSSDVRSAVPKLSSVEEYLQAGKPVKPLQHEAVTLRGFVAIFSDTKMPEKTCEALYQLGKVMEVPKWQVAHDAAVSGLGRALDLTTKNPTPELAAQANNVELIFKSAAPSAGTIDMVNHPELKEILKPLVDYIGQFENFMRGWMGISPVRMNATENLITPNQYAEKIASQTASVSAGVISSAGGAYCGDPSCLIDHSPAASVGAVVKETGAVHYHGGVACSVQHSNSLLSAAGKAVHFHDGVACMHEHDAAGKASGKWMTGLAAAGCVGAFVIHEFRKGKTKDSERSKSKEQKAEDIAYTLNHSLYCTLTDFINPPINVATDGWLRFLIPGCGHDHTSEINNLRSSGAQPAPLHGASRFAPNNLSSGGELSKWEKIKLSTKQSFSKERFVQYAKGEFVGDFGAVPLTISMQRYLPDVMQGIRNISEPLAAPLFKWGIGKSSQRWAREHHVEVDSPEYKKHEHDVYEYEMGHFPQAVVWTVSSLGLNVAYQMHSDKSNIPFINKLALKSGAVMSGVAVTAGMVVAARVLAPHKINTFDQWTSREIILPATRKAGKLFGVRDDDIARMEATRERVEGTWADSVAAQKAGLQGQLL